MMKLNLKSKYYSTVTDSELVSQQIQLQKSDAKTNQIQNSTIFFVFLIHSHLSDKIISGSIETI